MFELQEEQLKGNLDKKYLLVEIADNFYAFSITIVQEVLPMIEVFSVESDNAIVGIIKLRGESIPVYDFNVSEGTGLSKLNERQKLLILQFDSYKIAVIADNLMEIITVEKEMINGTAVVDKFKSDLIVEGKRVSFINSREFYKHILSALNLQQIPQNTLVPIEQKSLDIIKTRTEILNKEDSYIIADDTFLNEKFVVFRLNEEIYAFNILYVEEIRKIREHEISRIPCVPDFIRGIINVNGDYISLVDIKSFLNMSICPLPEKLDIIIIKVNGLRIALPVDEIIDIEQLQTTQMILTSSYEISFIKGEISNEKHLINMLDVEKLFSSQNINIENYDIE